VSQTSTLMPLVAKGDEISDLWIAVRVAAENRGDLRDKWERLQVALGQYLGLVQAHKESDHAPNQR